MKHTDDIRGLKHSATIIALLLLLNMLSHGVCAFGLGTFETEFVYTADTASSITYYITKQPSEHPLVFIDVVGNISDYVNYNFDSYWYSTRLDELDNKLTREINLTGITNASLTFYTKYDIEYGWDFGYVEISTDNGTTWSQLQGTGTTTYRDGGAYVGIPGAHAYTGAVADWTLETMNLTPYVGNISLIRFRYITDDYYAEHGWLIDDISISAIEFSDDVQSGRNGWIADGWVQNVIPLEDNSNAIPVDIDFTIPSDYDIPEEAGQVLIENIPGVDADFNPAHYSVNAINVPIPPLVEYIPPTPPQPGGGHGGGRHGPFRRDLSFFAEILPPHVLHRIENRRSDSPVIDVRLRLIMYGSHVSIDIRPLSGRPDSIKQDLPGVYRFFSINALNLPYEIIDDAIIRVAVPKTWMSQMGAVPADIVVTRHAYGRWTDIYTVSVDEDNLYYYFDAYTPGFSVFAVRTKSPIPEPVILEPVPTEKPNISAAIGVPFVGGNESVDDLRQELMAKSNATDSEWNEAFPEYTLEPVEERTMPIRLLAIILGIVLICAVCAALIIWYLKKPKVEVTKQDGN